MHNNEQRVQVYDVNVLVTVQRKVYKMSGMRLLSLHSSLRESLACDSNHLSTTQMGRISQATRRLHQTVLVLMNLYDSLQGGLPSSGKSVLGRWLKAASNPASEVWTKQKLSNSVPRIPIANYLHLEGVHVRVTSACWTGNSWQWWWAGGLRPPQLKPSCLCHPMSDDPRETQFSHLKNGRFLRHSVTVRSSGIWLLFLEA